MIKSLLYENELLSALQKEFEKAHNFHIASAMVSKHGILKLFALIERCLRAGGKGRVLFGIDLPSDPDAIEQLLSLCTAFPGRLELKYFRPLRSRIFHPKLFIFEGKSAPQSAILGSSNATLGGLLHNYEVNVLIRERQITARLSEYLDEHFEGAYSRDVTVHWLVGYRKLWARRDKLFKKVRELARGVRVAEHQRQDGRVPRHVHGHTFAFTGKIPEWPRIGRLYPKVRRLGGEIAEVEGIAKADCLVHAEIMGGRKQTRKLQEARRLGIPRITEEELWDIFAREEKLRQATRTVRARARASAAGA